VIVVAGEALVDLVPTGGADGALVPMLGGGPFNVAITVGRLGVPVAFVSRLSDDSFGAALLARLRDSHVDVGQVQRGREPTTLAVVGMGAGGAADYTFYVEGTADRLVADPGPLPSPVAALSLGTLSLVLEPGATVYETMLRRESARGLLTVLDPNIRPAMITDGDAYRGRFMSWLPDVGLLKMSVEDARWLSGDVPDAELLDQVRRWQRAGPAAVVLTKGDAGIMVLTGGGDIVEVPAARVEVVDTIGAGDTVQGALLVWLYRRSGLSKAAVARLGADDWHAALTFAGAAAGITVSRAGAEPPYAAELVHGPRW